MTNNLAEIRDESIEAVLTAYPELEEPIVSCINDCDFKVETPPKANLNQFLMSKVNNDCQDDIMKMRNDTSDSKVSDATGLQVASLVAILMDGNQLFDEHEKALIGMQI
ncbi:hypothetical protein GPJ56_004921 [Histomonas meleagridis]|uniref:uncharacterized protein n=1 Tax=Histomonas meleagridis TaxID=135588 RepID=UPI003559DAEB|nr:hypothetical protein GPJ56_004921 [Histomonas meleagridis]KAH0798553.1 hypothetical protein GO595_008418 [Histomonas meleagridis]